MYREAIRTRLISEGIDGSDVYVVIAGPAKIFAHYVTTHEEYLIHYVTTHEEYLV